jgi:hypothetical protein
VSILGSNVAQSVAGLSQAERIEAREKRPKDPKVAQRRTRQDEYDMVVVNTEDADAVRGLKGNDQEETREDRQEQPAYTGRAVPHAENHPRIDVEG